MLITEKIFTDMQRRMMVEYYGPCYATPRKVDVMYDVVISALKVLEENGAILLDDYYGISPNGQSIGVDTNG